MVLCECRKNSINVANDHHMGKLNIYYLLFLSLIFMRKENFIFWNIIMTPLLFVSDLSVPQRAGVGGGGQRGRRVVEGPDRGRPPGLLSSQLPQGHGQPHLRLLLIPMDSLT